MPLTIKPISDGEFVATISKIRSTADPTFLSFVARLTQERRLLVRGLTGSQQVYLRKYFGAKVHILKHLDGFLVYLEPDPVVAR